MRTPRRAAMLALTGVLTLAACGTQEDEMGNEDTTPGATSPPVDEAAQTSATAVRPSASINASASLASAPEGFTAGLEGLLVTYTVTNDGSEPIKVATDRAPAQARSATSASAAAWVSAGSAPDVARLSKQVFPVPSGVLPSDLHRAGSATLDPGASLEDTAFVTLPLVADLPEGSETITVTEDPLGNSSAVRQVEICVQLAPGPPPDQDPVFATTIAADATGTVTVCSDPINLPEANR